MSNESKKTNSIRGDVFINKYFAQTIIDIGGGNDPVVPHAEVFDLTDGNAQYITKYKAQESYHCVYSSHCLEHMKNVPLALEEWWKLVIPGGYMVLIVPHEDLYEQHYWPPIFNEDHKATFRMSQNQSWSPVSYNVIDLCNNLEKSQIVEKEIHDLNYDYNLQYKKFSNILIKIYRWQFSKHRLKRILAKKLYSAIYTKKYLNNHCNIGRPIDQTAGNALAQIQIVLQKM